MIMPFDIMGGGKRSLYLADKTYDTVLKKEFNIEITFFLLFLSLKNNDVTGYCFHLVW